MSTVSWCQQSNPGGRKARKPTNSGFLAQALPLDSTMRAVSWATLGLFSTALKVGSTSGFGEICVNSQEIGQCPANFGAGSTKPGLASIKSRACTQGDRLRGGVLERKGSEPEGNECDHSEKQFCGESRPPQGSLFRAHILARIPSAAGGHHKECGGHKSRAHGSDPACPGSLWGSHDPGARASESCVAGGFDEHRGAVAFVPVPSLRCSTC